MIKLKPQWSLRQLANGQWALNSEDAFITDITPDQVNILRKAEIGISQDSLVDDITDEEFTHLETFINRGFINQGEVGADAPFWELAGAYYHSVKEQQKHLSVSCFDMTSNQVGSQVMDLLERSGVQTRTGRKNVTLVFVDSMNDIPSSIAGVVMPVVCNRVRVTVGPLLFPWSYSDTKTLKPNEAYMDRANYELPAAAQALQVAWVANNILQYLNANRLRFVRHIAELNMAKMEVALWPV